MPKPRSGESKSDFMSRCVPQVVGEGKAQDQAVAMCNAFWSEKDVSKTETVVSFSKFDDDKQIAYGEVYIPMIPDSQGDFMTAEEIEKMAHGFMLDGLLRGVDTEHDLEDNGSVVVESFIARKGDPDFVEGSWVAAVKVTDELWPLVKSGELGGFSMYGKGERIPTYITIEVPDDGIVKGATDTAEDHIHEFFLKFDENGNFLGGETDVVNGHAHKITKGTVTEDAGKGDDKHRHRFSFVEALQSG